jgi:membrane protease YdiL (CAAX protease family)
VTTTLVLSDDYQLDTSDPICHYTTKDGTSIFTMVDQLASAKTCAVCGALLNTDHFQPDGLCNQCAAISAGSASGAALNAQLPPAFGLSPDLEQERPPDPDQPPWGPASGVGVWVASVAAIIFIPIIAVVLWFIIQSARGAALPNFGVPQELVEWLKSPTLLLVQVLSTIVAHAITVGICWMVVTRMGKRPFWPSLGWKWAGHSRAGLKVMLLGITIGFGPLIVAILARGISPRFGVIPLERLFPFAVLCTATGLAIAWRKWRLAAITSEEEVTPLWYWLVFSACVIVTLMGVTQVLSRVLPQSEENSFTELLKSSTQVRIAVAILATFTAPLVEEAVYRGLLYSGLRKAFGVAPTVLLVTLMFAGVHVLQYFGSWVSLAGLTLLSLALTLVRARTKSILPCVVIHTVNNAFFSVLILLNKAT